VNLKQFETNFSTDLQKKKKKIIFPSPVPQWLVLKFAMSLFQYILHIGPNTFNFDLSSNCFEQKSYLEVDVHA